MLILTQSFTLLGKIQRQGMEFLGVPCFFAFLRSSPLSDLPRCGTGEAVGVETKTVSLDVESDASMCQSQVS